MNVQSDDPRPFFVFGTGRRWASGLLCSLPLAVAGGAAGVLLALDAQAQQAVVSDEADQAKIEASALVRLDLQGMLTDPRVLETNPRDPVWQMQPSPGRVFVQLPFELLTLAAQGEGQLEGVPQDALSEGIAIKTPPVSLRGGRWIAWRLEVAGGEGGSGFQDFGGFGGGFEDFGGESPDGWNVGGGQPAQAAGDSGDADGVGGLVPASAPRLARSLVIKPDGLVGWSLERAMGGMQVADNGQSEYILKLRPDRLKELAPENPRRRNSGRSSGQRPSGFDGLADAQIQPRRSSSGQDAQSRRAAKAAEAQAALAYRKSLTEFNAMRKRVMALNEDFEAVPEDGRLYALYEVSEFQDRIELTGPEPLPWVMNLNDLAQLRAVAQGQSGRGGSAEQTQALLRSIQSGGEMGQRMAAEAIRLGGYASQIAPGDALSQALAAVIAGRSAEARRAVVRALSAVPATPVTVRLLSDGLRHMSPEDQLAALSGLLSPDASPEQTAQQITRTAGGFLADTEGPSVASVLDEVTRIVVPDPQARNRSRNADADLEVLRAVGLGMGFDRLPAERLADAVAYVVDHAHEPLSAAWLNSGLLGSSNTALVDQTLAALAGRSQDFPPAQLHSLDHSLLRLLSGEDTVMQDAAMGAVDRFRVESPMDQRSSRSSGSQQLGQDQLDVIAFVLDAGKSRSPIPASMAGFAAAQLANPLSADALIQMVLSGAKDSGDDASNNAQAVAAKAVVGSGQPIGRALSERPVDDRTLFAERLYAAAGDQPGVIVGLLEEPEGQSRVAQWFGQAVADTGLPVRGDWAQAVGGERGLLEKIQEGSPRVQLAAADALVATVGGTTESTALVLESLTSADGDLAEVWMNEKREIFSTRLAESAGPYRMSLNVFNQSYTGPAASGGSALGGSASGGSPGLQSSFGSGGAASGFGAPIFGEQDFDDPSFEGFDGDGRPRQSVVMPVQAIDIATVELIVDGGEVRLSNDAVKLRVADDRLALSVVSVRDLRFFDLDELIDLPLHLVAAPVDLLPQPGGVWLGRFALGSNQTGELVLTPVAPAKTALKTPVRHRDHLATASSD